MITIADHTLSRLVAQTRPHVGNLVDAEAVQCITFDHDGRHLYAMATNRYTIAVSRTQLTGGDDEPWHAIVHRTQLPELAAAVKLLDADTVQLERTDDQLVLSGKRGHRVAVDFSPFTQQPLDWRKLLLPALEKPAADVQMAMDPKFFGAWKNLPKPVQMWSTGEGRMSLIVAADFLGGQMPIRREGGDIELRRELDAWLAAKPVEAAEQVAA
ncbi:hypothetical protein TUSST3_08630 [Streptomyces sp. TUS-ST3]|uniref:hypothetical protein n=1 Tax=Streptomyces sp. TUS-ST3 TaxID=3025591 RepID=UPI0024E11670|nr:hypothetical protein [Streptomyces sp. TUS-ST3]GLP64243.1 hypothetical protein TUSST3_08630 [Streptomyces sp. TUS-ST3]